MLGRLYIDNKLDFEHTCLIMQSYLVDINNSYSKEIIDSLFDAGKVIEDIARDNDLNAEDCLIDLLFDMDFSFRVKTVTQSNNDIFFYNSNKAIYKFGLLALVKTMKLREPIAYILTGDTVTSSSDYKIVNNVQTFDFVGIFKNSITAIDRLKGKYFEVSNTSNLRIAILNVIRNGGLDKPLRSAFLKNVNTWGLRLNNKSKDSVFDFFKEEFVDYCEHDAKALDNYGCGFNIEPYLANVTGIVFKNRLTNLKNYVNSKSTLTKESSNGEDKAVAAVDRNEYIHKTATDYPEFVNDIRNIQACIDFCSTKRDKKLFAYYDKLTSVKDVLVTERFARSGLLDLYNDRSVAHSDIKRLATSICPFKHTKDWKSCEFTSDSEESKCISKRKAFLTAADTLDSTPPDKVSVLFEAFRSVQYGSGGTADDSKNRYVTKNYKAPDIDKGRTNIMDNMDVLIDFMNKMLIAVQAKISADRFIKHLEEVGIDLFDVSSAIASDTTLLNEFSTFSDFCDRYSISLRLRQNSAVTTRDDIDINGEVSKFILTKIKSSSSTFASAMAEQQPFSTNSKEAENMFNVSEFLRIKGADYSLAYHKTFFYLILMQYNKPLGKDIAVLSSVNKVEDMLNKYFNSVLLVQGQDKLGLVPNKETMTLVPNFPTDSFGEEGMKVLEAIGLNTDFTKFGYLLSDDVKSKLVTAIGQYNGLDVQQQFLKHIYRPCAFEEFKTYTFSPSARDLIENVYVTFNFQKGVIQDNLEDFWLTARDPEHIPYVGDKTIAKLYLDDREKLFSRQYFLEHEDAFENITYNGVVINSASYNEDFDNVEEFMQFLAVLRDYASANYVNANVFNLGTTIFLGALPIYQWNSMFCKNEDVNRYIAKFNEQLAFYSEMYDFLYNTFAYIRKEYKEHLINDSIAELFYYTLYHYRVKGKIFTDCSKILLTSSISKNLKVDCDKLLAVATAHRFKNLLDSNKRFTGDYRDSIENAVPIRLNDTTMSESITTRVISKIKSDSTMLMELSYENGRGLNNLNPKVSPSEYTLDSYLNRLDELLTFKAKGCAKYFVATQDSMLQKYAVLLNYLNNEYTSDTPSVRNPKESEKYYRWRTRNKLKCTYGDLKVLSKSPEMPFTKTTGIGVIFYSSSDLIQYVVTPSNNVLVQAWEGEE